MDGSGRKRALSSFTRFFGDGDPNVCDGVKGRGEEEWRDSRRIPAVAGDRNAEGGSGIGAVSDGTRGKEMAGHEEGSVNEFPEKPARS